MNEAKFKEEINKSKKSILQKMETTQRTIKSINRSSIFYQRENVVDRKSATNELVRGLIALNGAVLVVAVSLYASQDIRLHVTASATIAWFGLISAFLVWFSTLGLILLHGLVVDHMAPLEGKMDGLAKSTNEYFDRDLQSMGTKELRKSSRKITKMIGAVEKRANASSLLASIVGASISARLILIPFSASCFLFATGTLLSGAYDGGQGEKTAQAQTASRGLASEPPVRAPLLRQLEDRKKLARQQGQAEEASPLPAPPPQSSQQKRD